MADERGERWIGRRARTALVGTLYVALSALGSFYLYLDGALDCYESCYPDDPGWSNHTNSWQWDAIFWSGAAAAVAALVAFVAALLKQPRVAAAALALEVAAFCVGAAFATDDANRGVAVWFAVAWILATLASGAVFARRRRG